MRIKKTQSGFGLIELMVSIGVMVLVTSIVIVRQSTFNSTALLTNQAYEVAFDVRETQLRAVSAQGGVDADFRTQYGMKFAPDEQKYTFFRGEPSTPTLLGAPGNLDRRFALGSFNTSSGIIDEEISIVFERPEYDAMFFDGEGSVLDVSWVVINVCYEDTAEDSMIALKMAVGLLPEDLSYDFDGDGEVNVDDALNILRSGSCRSVKITNTGQITVN